MSVVNDTVGELRRRARVRGARRMVFQGLTLYYQSLVHRVHEETPSFFDHVLAEAKRRDPMRQSPNRDERPY